MQPEKIIKEEKKILAKLQNNIWLVGGIVALLLIAIVAVVIYFYVASGQVSIDNSTISAPSIDLTSKTGGILQEVYVNSGDILPQNTVVARVGTELIKTLAPAEVITVNNNIGKYFSPGQAIVTVIDPSQLRVVGKLQENKGLSDVRVGQRAIFSVDAFSSKQYVGIVDEISPTAHSGDVVFSISDKRQEQDFDVKVRFDVSAYPELKNGMSAKITVFKD